MQVRTDTACRPMAVNIKPITNFDWYPIQPLGLGLVLGSEYVGTSLNRVKQIRSCDTFNLTTQGRYHVSTNTAVDILTYYSASIIVCPYLLLLLGHIF
jgi:hypothetical protein